MTQTRVFSDEELSCYLDSEISDDLAAAIEAARAGDPQLAARLAALQSGQQAFEQAMQSALSAAPAMVALPDRAQPKGPSYWPVGLASAAMGAMAVFGLTTWFGASAPQPGWIDVVANYQSLYVTQTLEEVNQTPEMNAAQLSRLSENLGFDLTNLPAVPGLSYKRAQELGFRGKPLAQLTFLTASGGPVALCIIRTDAEDTAEIKAAVLKGLSAYSWTEDGYGILLVGPQGEPMLKKAAQTFREALKTNAI